MPIIQLTDIELKASIRIEPIFTKTALRKIQPTIVKIYIGTKKELTAPIKS